MQPKLTLPQSYILRIWVEETYVDGKPAYAQRYTLVDPHSGQRTSFVSGEALAAYLQTQMVKLNTQVDREIGK